jgi:dipeptidyl aminopeptidase/acylaminoacyl peptidase
MRRLALLAAVLTAVIAGPASDASRPAGRVAYTELVGGTWKLMVMDARGASRRPLGQFSWAVDPDWSPSRQQLAVGGVRPGDPNMQIYVMAADGSHARAVTFVAGFKRSPSWSPDGHRIVYSAQRHEQPTGGAGVAALDKASCELRVVDVITGRERPVFDRGVDLSLLLGPTFAKVRAVCATYPRWSPDGEWIAFQLTTEHNQYHRAPVFLVRPDGSDLHQVLSTSERGVAWTPDGRIAYAVMENGNSETLVRTAAVDGSDVRLLATVGAWGCCVSASPDGSAFLVRSNPLVDGAWPQVFRVDLRGGRYMQLTDTSTTHDWPDWG